MRLFELINVAKTFQNVGDKLTDRLENDESAEIQDAKKFIQYIADTIDPTRNSKYTMWILRLYIKGGINAYEDFGRVQAYLIIFDQYKQKMPIKDINQFKTLSDFGEMVLAFEIPDEEDLEGQSKKQKKKGEEQKFYDSGTADLVFNSNRVKVVIPKTVEASCYFGKNTQWCTAARDNNYFASYSKSGNLYILLDKKANKRFQFQSSNSGLTLMDENDRPVDPKEFIKTYPEMLTIKSIFNKQFDGGNFKLYEMPRRADSVHSINYLIHSKDDVQILNIGERGLRINARYDIRSDNLELLDYFELYPNLLKFDKLFKFEKNIGNYSEYTLPSGTKLFVKPTDKDYEAGVIQTYKSGSGLEIELNGKKAKQHDFINQLPELFYGLYEPIANFGRFEVYRSKNDVGRYILRSQNKTFDIEFGGKFGQAPTQRVSKKDPQKTTGMIISEDTKKVPTIHNFFNDYPELLTVKEIFSKEGSREGFDIYKLPLSDKNMQHMLRNENQTMIVKEDIAKSIRAVEFAMPPKTRRKGIGFVAPFEEGLQKLPGASKNAVLKHTENWNRGWDSKGKGRQSFKRPSGTGLGPMPFKKKDEDLKDKVWLQNGAPMEIDWYEIYGLLGELADWGELKVRWSYYAHGRDKIGNEYWYAYDQGGHIQSGTGTYRFKPVE